MTCILQNLPSLTKLHSQLGSRCWGVLIHITSLSYRSFLPFLPLLIRNVTTPFATCSHHCHPPEVPRDVSPLDPHFVGNLSRVLCHSNVKLTHTPARIPKGCVHTSIWLQTNQSTLGHGQGQACFCITQAEVYQTEAVSQLEGKCFVVLATSIAVFHASCLGTSLAPGNFNALGKEALSGVFLQLFPPPLLPCGACPDQGFAQSRVFT